MNRLRGVFPPTLVPFRDADLSFDEAAFGRHLRFLESAGVDGVVVLGTNGEFHSLSLDEKRAVLAAAAARRGRLALVAGTGATSLSEAASIAREAARLRYDGLLVAPPFYPRGLKAAGVAAFVRGVIDAGEGLPAYLYHIPQFTGVPFDRPLVQSLLAGGGIAGLKDSTGSIESLAAYRADFPGLDVFVGSDSIVLEGRRRGAAGAVTGVSNVLPELVVRVWRGPEPETEDAQRALAAVRALSEGKDLPAFTKALLGLRGFPRSPVRPPLVPLSGAEVEACAARLRSLRLLDSPA